MRVLTEKGLFTLFSVAVFTVGVARKKSQMSTLNVTLIPEEHKQPLLVKVKKMKFMIFSRKGKGFALSSGTDKKTKPHMTLLQPSSPNSHLNLGKD